MALSGDFSNLSMTHWMRRRGIFWTATTCTGLCKIGAVFLLHTASKAVQNRNITPITHSPVMCIDLHTRQRQFPRTVWGRRHMLPFSLWTTMSTTQSNGWPCHPCQISSNQKLPTKITYYAVSRDISWRLSHDFYCHHFFRQGSHTFGSLAWINSCPCATEIDAGGGGRRYVT